MTRINRIIATLSCALIFASCSGEKTETYTIVPHVTDRGRIMNLIQGTERVLERKIAAKGLENITVRSVPTGMTGALTVTTPDGEARKVIKSILTTPFTFDVRLLKPGMMTGSLASLDRWEPPALTGSSIVWVQGKAERSTGAASVEISFTPTGTTILQKLFKEHVGEDLGLFVKDILVSKLTIKDPTIGSSLVIQGVPSPKVAEIFADDVNVGLFTTLVPHH